MNEYGSHRKMLHNNQLRSCYVCSCGTVINSLDQIGFRSRADRINSTETVYKLSDGLSCYIDTDYKEIIAITENGTPLADKCCCSCRQQLPANVGVTPLLKAVLLGPKGRGKTVYMVSLQLLMSSIINSATAAKYGFNIHRETASKRYEQHHEDVLEQFKRGTLPEPTRPAPGVPDIHISMQVINESSNFTGDILFYDLPGETLNDICRSGSTPTIADVIFYFIDASDLEKPASLSLHSEYLKNLFMGRRVNVPIYVLLAKSDLREDFGPLKAKNTLIKQPNGTYTSPLFSGFNYDVVAENRKYAKDLLCRYRFWEDLRRVCPEHLLHPYAISCCQPNGLADFCYCEAPFLEFLARTGIFPWA